MNNSEICVPAGSLDKFGEDGAGAPPGVGDEVEFTVRGQVTRSGTDGALYVRPVMINDEKLTETPPPDGAAQPEEGIDDYVAKARAGGGEDMP